VPAEAFLHADLTMENAWRSEVEARVAQPCARNRPHLPFEEPAEAGPALEQPRSRREPVIGTLGPNS